MRPWSLAAAQTFSPERLLHNKSNVFHIHAHDLWISCINCFIWSNSGAGIVLVPPSSAADEAAVTDARLREEPLEGEEPMRPLKILIADDHALMLEAVKLALENEADLEVVAQAESGSQILPLVNQTDPDLVLLDLEMPGIDGLTCIKLLRKRAPWVRTIVLSAHDSCEVVEAALEAGADAFIVKSVDPATLASAIRQALEKRIATPIGREGDAVHPAVEESGLSKREVDVLRALAEGKSNKEIAQTLWLAQQTVKFHLTSIYRKLDVNSRTQAVNWAYQHGLVELPFAGSPSVDQSAPSILERPKNHA
jgi:DNA-binding NarL/FixJ family response regulator